MRHGVNTWRAFVVLLLFLLSLMGTPAAANAAFNDTETANMPVAAARLPAPAPTSVTVTKSCDTFLWWAQVKVSVGSSYGQVPYANFHELKVFNPAGGVEFTGDLSKTAGRAYSSGIQNAGDLSGTWKYEVRGYYKVPNSSNTWAGQPLTGTLTCP